MRTLLPLVSRWPELAGRIPAVGIGRWPTPVEPFPLPGLPAGAEVWIKRDDLSSPIYGGNKVRKLELLLARDPRPVLTIGASGSHHVLATALHARALGRDCYGVMIPQTPSHHAAEVEALNRRHCAGLVRLDRPPRNLARLALRAPAALARLIAAGGVNYIPPGGSTPWAVVGYATAGLELAAQVADGSCPEPHEIYVPLGTGSTAAGLAYGLGLAGLSTRVVAVRIASPLAGNRLNLASLARRCHRLLARAGLPVSRPSLNLRLEHGFNGPGYARATPAAREAEARAARCGIRLETTYSAKTLAALLAALERIPGQGPTMFLDTFGPIDHLKQPRARDEEL